MPTIIKPFRWNVENRNELGTLIENQVANFPAHYYTDLLASTARLLAYAGPANIFFVGRSPEHYFDFLKGIFYEKNVEDNFLNLFHFSGRGYDTEKLMQRPSKELTALKGYMHYLGLSPAGIISNPKQTCLVDLVCYGGTFTNLLILLRRWCEDENRAWKSVHRKLRIVGITSKKKASPNTWRWQQDPEYAWALQQIRIKNISISRELWSALGDHLPKACASFFYSKWNDETVLLPDRSKKRLEGLKIADQLFTLGRNPKIKIALKAELVRQREIKYPWFRALIQKLN